jgi:hypothetical protein
VEHTLRHGDRGVGEDGTHLEAVGGGVEEAEAELEVAGDGRAGIGQTTLIGEPGRDGRCGGETCDGEAYGQGPSQESGKVAAIHDLLPSMRKERIR